MRRFLRADQLVTATAVVILVAIVLSAQASPCTVEHPCGPAPGRWIAYGALLAPAVMVYLHRWAAAAGAVACAVVWVVAEHRFGAGFGLWVVAPWLLVSTAIGVARRRTGPAEQQGPRRRPPAPADLPRVAVPIAVGAVALALLAAGGGAAVLWRQSAAERQEAAARVATGVVRAHLGDDGAKRVLRIELPDGETAENEVFSAGDYPVGSRVELYLDSSGLRQLRSEPYDVTPWLALVVMALGLAGALLARFAQRRHDLRVFFAGPQPVRPVRVVDQFGYVHVLVPAADGRTAVEFGIDVAEPGAVLLDDPATGDEEPETRPALLYGEPRPGRWCAVEVDGRLHVPVAPVRETVLVAYDAAHGLPQEIYDDDEQRVDPAALTAADRTAAPDQPREHRIAPVRAWFSTIAAGLGLALLAGQVAELFDPGRGWPFALAVTAAATAGYELAWRIRLRPRLRWHAGGVAAIGFRQDRIREIWTYDSAAVHDDEGTVVLTAGDAVLAVEAPKPWPSWVAQRTPEQLVAALRDARRQALDGDETLPPPDLDPPHRPVALVLAWAASVAVVLALLEW